MWKILIREEAYHSLVRFGLFPEEQKGCLWKTKGTNDQLYINQHILKKKKKNAEENKAMTWIYFLKKRPMTGPVNLDNRASENVQNIWQNQKLHRKYHGQLEHGIDCEEEATPNRFKNRKRHLFTRETHSPAAFWCSNDVLRECTEGYKFIKSLKIDYFMYRDDIQVFALKEKEQETLIQIIRIYSQDIEKRFGIEKCALLIMKSRKKETTVGTELSNQERIRTLSIGLALLHKYTSTRASGGECTNQHVLCGVFCVQWWGALDRLWLRAARFVRVCSTIGYNTSGLRGPSPKFNPLRRGWNYRPAPEELQRENRDGARGIFGTAWRVWAPALRQNPP